MRMIAAFVLMILAPITIARAILGLKAFVRHPSFYPKLLSQASIPSFYPKLLSRCHQAKNAHRIQLVIQGLGVLMAGAGHAIMAAVETVVVTGAIADATLMIRVSIQLLSVIFLLVQLALALMEMIY